MLDVTASRASLFFFFFQAEDGIRDIGVTGVQTCALPISEHGATIYVGDHLGDIQGAKAAGAIAVGVTTGPCSRAELEDEGADVVFESLEEFPEWFASVPP